MITLYGQPSCQPCRLIRRQLDKAGVPYEYVDLSRRPDKAKRLREQGLQSTPILETSTEQFTGYQPDRIKKAITQAQQELLLQQRQVNRSASHQRHRPEV